jgi:hypothetical protein
MANSWSKQPVWVSGYINNVNDTIVGGQLSSVPVGVVATQGDQTLLGDHLVLDEAAANAKSTTASGFAQLHGGYYQYVQFDSSATTPALGQTLYWKLTSNISGPYTVTNVATANQSAYAGVLLNPNVTAGNYTWIQTAGRATVLFAASGTTTAGVAVYGTVGSPNATVSAGAVSDLIGVAEGDAVASTLHLVDLNIKTLRF